MFTKLTQPEFDILQTIANTRNFQRRELPDLSGWNQRLCDVAVARFNKLGLIEKFSGRYVATTKGKLALAILTGQRRKKTYARITSGTRKSGIGIGWRII